MHSGPKMPTLLEFFPAYVTLNPSTLFNYTFIYLKSGDERQTTLSNKMMEKVTGDC